MSRIKLNFEPIYAHGSPEMATNILQSSGNPWFVSNVNKSYIILKFEAGFVQIRSIMIKNYGSAFIRLLVPSIGFDFHGQYNNLDLDALVSQDKLKSLVALKQLCSFHQFESGNKVALMKGKNFTDKKDFSRYISTSDLWYDHVIIEVLQFPGYQGVGCAFVTCFGSAKSANNDKTVKLPL